MKLSLTDKQRKVLELFLILCIVTVVSISTLSATNPLLNPPGRDGGFFLYVGKAIKSGAKLYEDIWDSKGPLIFWINALGVGNDFSRWGVFALELLFMSSAFFILYCALKKHYGNLAGIVAVIVGTLLLKPVIGPGNSTEEYALLFTAISIASIMLLIHKPKFSFLALILMGMMVVLNFLLRANNIGTSVVVIITALMHITLNKKGPKIWQALFCIIGGILIVAVPIMIYFSMNGTLSAMLNASLIYNFSYSTSSGKAFSNSLLPALSYFRVWFVLFFLVWLYGIIELIHQIKTKKTEPFLVLTILALPIEAIMSSVSGRGHNHYFICWIPALMLLTAYFISKASIIIKNKYLSEIQTKKLPITLGIILLILLVGSFSSVFRTTKLIGASIIRPNLNREYRDSLSKRIIEITDASDKVLVFGGQAGINMMSQRDSINTALFYPAINDSDIGLQVQADFFETLKKEQPRLIIDMHAIYPEHIPAINPETQQYQRFVVNFSSNLDEVIAWINEHYEEHETIDNYIIYRLKDIQQQTLCQQNK